MSFAASAATAASIPANAGPPSTNGATASNGITTAAAPLVPALKSAIVRSVLSGDTIVIRPKGVNIPGKEETVHIAGIAAPRLGSRDREDDPQAFPSREYLRLLTVGREIRYRIEYTVPAPAAVPGSTVAQPRQFAHVFLPPKAPGQPDTNVAHEILAAGWAKVHDSVARRSDEADDGSWKQKLRTVQDEAIAAGVGLWGPDDLLKVDHSMPEDTSAFLAEWKGKPIESIVEQVRDGSMLRVRLLLSSTHQQMINLSLAGIKAPRVTGGGGASPTDASEPYGEEAKFFVESRLLQRNIKVTLLSVPQPVAAPTPFASTASAAPTPAAPSASVLIGLAIHPVGDIAQFLLSAGLARCVDWHAGMLASYGGMEKYRQSERTAKEKRLNLWRSYSAPASSSTTLASQPVAARTFDGVVSRIISGDTIQVRKVGADGELGPEKRIQFSSLRQPQAKDAKQAGYAAEAREFLRKRLVGKTVSVQMDYIKPKEGDFDEREYATVKQGNKDSDIGLLLISKGLATVQRHRRDDEDRSPNFDGLMEAEAKAVTEAKGIHSGKELPAPRMGDASETASKANTFLPGLKRAGRLTAIVDFVASASRFKLIVPRENVRLTFVLAGIRAPKTARNHSEKDEPFGREGLDFSTMRALQRDVEIEVFSTDKVGGFIGALYLNKTDNLAVSLVESGLATVHGYSAEATPFYKSLLDAEEKAKSSKLGLWHDYDAAAEEAEYGEPVNAGAAAGGASAGAGPARSGGPAWGGAANGGAAAGGLAAPAPARTEYVDCIISDVRGSSGPDDPFGFSIQVLNDQIQELETLMEEFSLHHKSPAASSASFIPRVGDLVSAKFSQDGAWYRAIIRKVSPGLKEAQVSFIDYGNKESVKFRDLRPLDSSRFGRTRLAPQARDARLSFVRLYDGKQAEYVEEALDRFRAIAAEGRKMIANIDFVEPGTNVVHVSLYDPESPGIGQSPEQGCINYELTKEGYALLDDKVRYWKSYPVLTKALKAGLDEARSRHRGCFEYGDPTED
ncbi:Staphylococcal nuclease (SNase-like), OB-fold [Kalmanozyma brasiliensis GHG001]|uniref:Transcriptional coactivator p100 n=1 Tax=Kalmanozyma brasiliensis (strain GHG001) TaxID=1365824 RepID=V5EYP4_KALBG|nr:Staphylococcal nuclease (SNase-like), OB-fold [Kalmanozyma brasiliensis GHG001]EST07919.1 Staphylococcal nuclease (SNase-like), OB-fold [Kalmanozyma brasiliensis GHG001]